MINAWKVIWKTEDGRKLLRKGFNGDSPRESGAVAFGKKLQERGLKDVTIVSSKKAFAPPLAKQKPPEVGMLWCPYCLKWRFFRELSIRYISHRGPLLWRCPICTISIHDPYVKKFNFEMVTRLDVHVRPQVPSNKMIKRRISRK